MQSQLRPSRWRNLAGIAACLLALGLLGGCTLHRNVLVRWHMEFDCDKISDEEVPCSADDHCRCPKCSRLGRPPAVEPTPAQTGHARFHPLPTRPVFPAPSGADMADMGPPAPQWYERQHEPLQEKGRIERERSIPAPDLEDIEKPMPPMPQSGWDVNNS